MKKTLCLFFVLALVAQICARPEGKDDADKTAKEAADKATKEVKDKAHEAREKAQAEGNKAKEVSDDLQKKGKAAADEFGKEVKDGQKPELNKHHGHQLSAMIREAEKTGEKFIESGSNLFTNLVEKIGL